MIADKDKFMPENALPVDIHLHPTTGEAMYDIIKYKRSGIFQGGGQLMTAPTWPTDYTKTPHGYRNVIVDGSYIYISK